MIRANILAAVDEAIQSGAKISACAELIGLSTRTLQRWKVSLFDARKGSQREIKHKLSPQEKAEILKTVNSLEFVDKSPREIVPILADRNIYLASEASFYRVMREFSLLTHRRRSKKPERRNVPRLHATKPDQIWSWDITYLKGPRTGTFFYLYMIIDIFSRKIISARVYTQESSALAAEFVEEAVYHAGLNSTCLTLHSDNGGPMRGAPLQATLQKLGVASSFSRPRTSDDNPFSESLFKTFKYGYSYPKSGFESMTAAEQFVAEFVKWYNEDHLHSAIHWVTPESRHKGEDLALLENRIRVYNLAKMRNPLRWSGKIRNWNRINWVSLNPEKPEKINLKLR